MRCSLRHERALRKAGVEIIAGIDEAGRGPLAGPVVAAAVILPEGFRHKTLTDSKQLREAVREEIFCELTAEGSGVIWAASISESEEIDRITKEIDADKEAEAERKKAEKRAGDGATTA